MPTGNISIKVDILMSPKMSSWSHYGPPPGELKIGPHLQLQSITATATADVLRNVRDVNASVVDLENNVCNSVHSSVDLISHLGCCHPSNNARSQIEKSPCHCLSQILSEGWSGHLACHSAKIFHGLVAGDDSVQGSLVDCDSG